MSRHLTLNEAGHCDCGNRTFTVLEQVRTKVSLALEPGVLVQYGPMEMSEIINAWCDHCGLVWDVTAIGAVKFKELAA